jgi:hypothetical protein
MKSMVVRISRIRQAPVQLLASGPLTRGFHLLLQPRAVWAVAPTADLKRPGAPLMHHLLIYSADHDPRVPPSLGGNLTPVPVRRSQDITQATLAPWWNAAARRYDFNGPLQLVSREALVDLDFYPAADGFVASERLLALLDRQAAGSFRSTAIELIDEEGRPNSARPMQFCQILARQPVVDHAALGADPKHHPALDGANLVEERDGRLMIIRAMRVPLRPGLPALVEADDLPKPAMLVSERLRLAFREHDIVGARLIPAADIAVVDFWPDGPGAYAERAPNWIERSRLDVWTEYNGSPERARFITQASRLADPEVARLLAGVRERQERTPEAPDWRERMAQRYPALAAYDLETAMQFWIKLRDLFERAVANGDEAQTGMILSDARDWLDMGATSTDPQDDPYTAVVIGFLEGLLGVRGADGHLLEAFSHEELLNMKSILGAGLSEGRRYAALMAFSAKRKRWDLAGRQGSDG